MFCHYMLLQDKCLLVLELVLEQSMFVFDESTPSTMKRARKVTGSAILEHSKVLSRVNISNPWELVKNASS